MTAKSTSCLLNGSYSLLHRTGQSFICRIINALIEGAASDLFNRWIQIFDIFVADGKGWF